MTCSHFIEILMILTKYVFNVGVWLPEYSVTVGSVTLRFYCIIELNVIGAVSISGDRAWEKGPIH